MTKVSEIAKQTLLLLNQRGLKATPENYSDVFEELSQELGLSGGSKEKLDKYKALLIPKYQEEVNKRGVKNIDELISFLISSLNRKNIDKAKEFFELLETVFNALVVSKDKKVRDLASSSNSALLRTTDSRAIFLLSKKWQDFAENYEDLELDEELRKYGIKNDEFKGTIKKLLFELEQRSFERFAKLISMCLPPSLSKNENIEKFSNNILEKPYLLAKKQDRDEFENELFEIVNKRINSDLNFTQRYLSFFNQNLQNLNKLLDSLSSLNKTNVDFINKFEKDKQGNISLSFDDLKSKFISLNDKMNAMFSQIKEMGDDKKIQDWTLQKQILKMDENFIQEKINYALCIFTVSNYRYIMEKYGLSSLNEILLRFKKFLKDRCTDKDELWILDEKSYLLILNDIEYEKLISFVQDCHTVIENFRFIYKQDIVKPVVNTFFMDKSSYPHLNIFDELLKKLD